METYRSPISQSFKPKWWKRIYCWRRDHLYKDINDIAYEDLDKEKAIWDYTGAGWHRRYATHECIVCGHHLWSEYFHVMEDYFLDIRTSRNNNDD